MTKFIFTGISSIGILTTLLSNGMPDNAKFDSSFACSFHGRETCKQDSEKHNNMYYDDASNLLDTATGMTKITNALKSGDDEYKIFFVFTISSNYDRIHGSDLATLQLTLDSLSEVAEKVPYGIIINQVDEAGLRQLKREQGHFDGVFASCQLGSYSTPFMYLYTKKDNVQETDHHAVHETTNSFLVDFVSSVPSIRIIPEKVVDIRSSEFEASKINFDAQLSSLISGDAVNIQTSLVSLQDTHSEAITLSQQSIDEGTSSRNGTTFLDINEAHTQIQVNLRHILAHRPFVQWNQVVQLLSSHRGAILRHNVLVRVRKLLENHEGTPLHIQQQLLEMYPKELGFSMLLYTLRFPAVHSTSLMTNIFTVMQKYIKDHAKYCNAKFNGNLNIDDKSEDRIIGEALTLVFSFFDSFVPAAQTGNLRALKLVRDKYPNSILYVDAHEFTPLHGVCCALNMGIFKFFIEWHLEQKPKGRGGLYEMNDSGITPMDTMIDTHQDITPTLHWLRRNVLLQSKDVRKWLLIHRASHSSSISTIRFFLELFPSGVLLEDSDGNLPIHLHLGLRYRGPERTFSEQDFAIVHLLLSRGIPNGGINTIGGLFHEDPDAENSCTLSMLLKEARESNIERVWGIVGSCLNEHGDYINAPIVHAAISNKKDVSNELFREILGRFGANSRNEHNKLPLQHAVEVGMAWDGGVSEVLELNRQEALYEVDRETSLPLLAFAACKKADLSTLYELSLLKLDNYLESISQKNFKRGRKL